MYSLSCSMSPTTHQCTVEVGDFPCSTQYPWLSTCPTTLCLGQSWNIQADTLSRPYWTCRPGHVSCPDNSLYLPLSARLMSPPGRITWRLPARRRTGCGRGWPTSGAPLPAATRPRRASTTSSGPPRCPGRRSACSVRSPSPHSSCRASGVPVSRGAGRGGGSQMRLLWTVKLAEREGRDFGVLELQL